MPANLLPFPERSPPCAQCAIRHRSICGALSAEELKDLNAIAVRRQYSAGDAIQWQSSDARMVGNLTDGVAKVTRMLADGRLQIVSLLFPGDFVGRPFAREAAESIEAATDCEICAFPRDRFEKVLKRYPDLETRLFARKLDELDAAHDLMLLLGRKTATEKVATFLVKLARRFQEVGCESGNQDREQRFVLPLSRGEIADFLGLTIETVSRQVSRLRTAGIIEVSDNRTIEIVDVNELARMAGEAREEDGRPVSGRGEN